MILFNSPISGNCYKVRLLLAHIGIAIETRDVDVVDRTDPRDFLAGLNPVRRAPTLVLDDGRPLGESGAILLFLGEGTSYVPEDRYLRAQVLQWMFFEQYSHEPYVAVVRFWLTHGDTMPPEAEVETRRAGGYRALAAMERHLGSRTFLVGETYTVADIALYAYTHIADESGLELEPYPAVQRWLAGVASVPGHVAMDA